MSGGSGVAAGTGWTGATGVSTRLVLLRHGQTALSVERRYSGLGDPPLTELGRRQAAAAAAAVRRRYPDADAVVCSPLTRARQTAEALGLPTTVDDGLAEVDFGAWEGLTFAEAAAATPELHSAWLGDASVPPPDGESFADAAVRVRAARERIVAAYAGRTVVVVTHVSPIKLTLADALGVGTSLLYRLHLELASISVAEWYTDGNSTVRLIGDAAFHGA